MEVTGAWSYKELSHGEDTTNMAAKPNSVVHKAGKKYTAFTDSDEGDIEDLRIGGIPRTSCCGLCMLHRSQAFSAPLFAFISLSITLSPLAITPYLSESQWYYTTSFHSVLGIACIVLLACTTFIEPGVLPKNPLEEPIIPKTKEYSDLLPFRTISRTDAEAETSIGLQYDTPSLKTTSATSIWVRHQNLSYRNWGGNYRYWALRKRETSSLEAIYNCQQRLIHSEADNDTGRAPGTVIRDEDVFPLRTCTQCNLIIYPQVVHLESRLGHCISGFDHFCLWTGSVIGHRNYAAYASFLFSLWLFSGSGIIFSCLVLERLLSGTSSGNGLKVSIGVREQYQPFILAIFGLLHLAIFAYVSYVGGVHLYLQAKRLTQSQHMSLDEVRKKFSQARFAFSKGHSFVLGYNDGNYVRSSQVPTIILEGVTSAQHLRVQPDYQ